MRLILLGFTLCLSLLGQVTGSIAAIPGLPMAGTMATLVLTASPLPSGPVTWDYGDGSKVQSGGTVATHVYSQPGSFTVRATYLPINGQVPSTIQTQLRVIFGQGPSAPFTISQLRLRWEDGRTDLSVTQGQGPLQAFADVKFEGTGLFQAQWTVDGIPLAIFTRQLAFAGQLTMDSGGAVSLPTFAPGEHLVTLRILSPAVTFQVPVIRYFVRLGRAEEAPRIEEVLPSALRPGQEVELRITGKGLTPETALSFGKDIALVGPLRFSEPGKAMAKVFVAPTAKPGLREIQASSRSGSTQGPAHLQILPVPRIEVPTGPRQAQVLSGHPLLSPGGGLAHPTLLQSLMDFFVFSADPTGPDGSQGLFPPPAKTLATVDSRP